jgi:pilus assembly protein FimV
MAPALLLPLGMVPLGAQALGLGALRVTSALGQPLAARIDLVGATPAEAELAAVSLASPEAHRQLGVDSSLGGIALRFAVKVGANGRSYVSVTSHEPVREPYLDFVVEAISPTGQVARHYTVLLDPVDIPASPVAAPAARSWSPLVTPIPQRAAAPRPRRNPFANVGQPKAGSVYGPVPPGDTLWAIARRVQPAGADLDAVMTSIVRANPQAFINGDPARLKAGSKLDIPGTEGLRVQPQAAVATEEPQPVAPVSAEPAAAPPPAAEAEPAPAPTTAVPPPQAEVRVLRGEDVKPATAPTAVPAEGSGDRVQLLEEALDAATQQNEALQQRLGSLEEQIKTLTALVKTDPAVEATDAVAAGDGPAVADQAAQAAPTAATAPTVPASVAPAPAPAEGVGVAVYQWGAAAGLGLAGLLFWLRRRRASTTVVSLDDAPHDAAPSAVVAAPATHAEWVDAAPAPAGPPVAAAAESGFGDPVDTQIDLLTAYVGMADGPSARQIYDEIQRTGNAEQKAQAAALLARLEA